MCTHPANGVGQTSPAAARCHGTRRARGTALSMNTQQQQPLEMTPRRKQFFRMVSEGLKVGFEGEDLSRIESFVRYCKGELDYKSLGPFHQVWFSSELDGRAGWEGEGVTARRWQVEVHPFWLVEPLCFSLIACALFVPQC